jgi:transcriptional regulator with GAF, ATPase, and Fis domain
MRNTPLSQKKVNEYILEAKNSEKLLFSIHKISNLLTRPVSLDKILTAIVKETSNVFGFSRVALFLKDKHSNLLECKYLIGFQPHERARALRLPFHMAAHDCIETMVVKSGETVFIKDHQNDRRITNIDLKVSSIHKRVSTLAVPLKIKKDVIGLIEADKNDIKMKLTQRDIKSFTIFANQASIIIENAKLQARNKKRIEQLLSWQEVETDVVGDSEGIKNALALTFKIAKSHDTTVLIEGETGTGKEIIARALHYHSSRVGKPYISINCGAISKDLVESELFGYEKGTFTGGLQEGKKGKFELADGGSLLLDEVSELLPSIQVKLLRFLEEREFYPVGGTEKKRVDVRIIAATNKSLEQEIRAGNFREDLYYRLNIAKISLPPLRERKEDIIPIGLFFMNKFNIRHGKNFIEISEEAQKILKHYSWVGNIRELRNAIERIVLMEEGTVIDPHHLVFLTHSQDIFARNGAADRLVAAPGPRKETSGYTDRRDPYPNTNTQDTELFREALQYFIRHNTNQDPEKSTADMIREALLDSRKEKVASLAGSLAPGINLNDLNKNLLIQALQICEGNKTKAAKLLGISRPTAVYRINKYGLKREVLK